MSTNLSAAQLRQAADLTEKIEQLQEQLSQLLAGNAVATKAAAPEVAAKPGKRRMSAAGRAAIAAGQKARWAKKASKVKTAAKAKSEAKVAAKVAAKPAKKKISSAGRAAIAAAQKARWAKIKADKASKSSAK